MKLELKKIDTDKVVRVSKFAKDAGIDRKMLYYFLDQNRLDFVEIDTVKFVVLNERAENFKKNIK